jgi:hypothetical protein
MLFAPSGSVEVERVAIPAAPRGTLPRVVEPSVNMTLPVGVEPLPVTLAVSITACPEFAVVGEAASVVVDVALPVILTETALEVDPAVVALPA